METITPRRVSTQPSHAIVVLGAAGLTVWLAIAVGLGQRALWQSWARKGATANATIQVVSGATGSRHALVRFITPTGVVNTTSLTICHHQAYIVGAPVPVVYDAKAPTRAWEKGMAPSPHFVLPLLMVLLGSASPLPA